MAEDNSGGGEKEFEATEQRKREARREGNVPQSREANTFSLMAGMVIAAVVFSATIAGQLFEAFSSMFYHAAPMPMTSSPAAARASGAGLSASS